MPEPAFSEQYLVNLDQVRNYCRITDTAANVGNNETQDQILGDLIVRASSFLTSLIGLPNIFAKDVVSIVNGNGKNVLFTPVSPINSVTSVSIDGILIPQSIKVFDYGWKFDSDAIYLFSYLFYQGIQNTIISWNIGISPTSSKSYILQQACLELINIKWQRRKHPDISIEKGANIVSVSYIKDDITTSIQSAIDLLQQHTVLFT